jgi:ABC-type sugar transport system ATPase subunit
MTNVSHGPPARVANSLPLDAVLVATGLTKHFPGVRALDNVSFSIAPGEIVSLLGQNGAGKSTLIQIFAGAHSAGSYDGLIALDGQSYQPRDVAEAVAAGVALVPQEVNIVPDLTVAENITLNNEPVHWGIIDVSERLFLAKKALIDFDIDVDPGSIMSSHDLATQQLIVIARALARNARLLILDEPTAALTEHESLRLFNRMRSLKARGVAIIFVSHRLNEVFTISDRIVVMRDGRICGQHRVGDVSRQDIVVEMIGNVASNSSPPAKREPGGTALEIRNLNVFGPGHRKRVHDLSLTIRKGDVVGLFGLLGSGGIEAALAIFGAWLGGWEGMILVDGVERTINTPNDAVSLGMGLMAQDRRDCLIGDQSISDNIRIASLGKIVQHGVLDVSAGRQRAGSLMEALHIKATSIDAEVRTLSGGNQQKVQIARWLAADTHILIMIDPTRGVDVGARREIKSIWSELATKGHAILLASTDVEELADACDRVVVMNNGRAVGELRGADLTERNLLRMATDG